MNPGTPRRGSPVSSFSLPPAHERIPHGNIRLPTTAYTFMNIEFNGKIWFWKGPSPWFFVTVPEKESRDLKAISGVVTYGWGVIPVHVRIGNTEWTTSLFPKDERYLVPIKASVRKAENLEEGDEVTVRLEVH